MRCIVGSHCVTPFIFLFSSSMSFMLYTRTHTVVCVRMCVLQLEKDSENKYPWSIHKIMTISMYMKSSHISQDYDL